MDLNADSITEYNPSFPCALKSTRITCSHSARSAKMSVLTYYYFVKKIMIITSWNMNTRIQNCCWFLMPTLPCNKCGTYWMQCVHRKLSTGITALKTNIKHKESVTIEKQNKNWIRSWYLEMGLAIIWTQHIYV